MDATSKAEERREDARSQFTATALSSHYTAGLSGCDVISADGTRLNVTLSDGHLKATLVVAGVGGSGSCTGMIGRCVAEEKIWDEGEMDRSGLDVCSTPHASLKFYLFYERLNAIKTCSCRKWLVYEDNDTCVACHFAVTQKLLMQ
jgi:hypothetical protein